MDTVLPVLALAVLVLPLALAWFMAGRRKRPRRPRRPRNHLPR